MKPIYMNLFAYKVIIIILIKSSTLIRPITYFTAHQIGYCQKNMKDEAKQLAKPPFEIRKWKKTSLQIAVPCLTIILYFHFKSQRNFFFVLKRDLVVDKIFTSRSHFPPFLWICLRDVTFSFVSLQDMTFTMFYFVSSSHDPPILNFVLYMWPLLFVRLWYWY